MPDAFGYATPEEKASAFGNPLLRFTGPHMTEAYNVQRGQVMANQGQEALGIADLVRAGQKPEPTMLDKLFGLGGVERFQTWPERMVRSAVTLPQQVYAGEVPVQALDPQSGEVRTSPEVIERTQDLAGMAMAGAIPAATKGALGSAGGRLVQPQPKEPVAPVWHSAVELAVRNAGQKEATPDQWLGTIKNTPGVKNEELEWLGLNDWLKEQKGPVSKKDVQDFIDSHQVEVKDALNTNTNNLPFTEGGAPRSVDEVVESWNYGRPYFEVIKEGNHYKVIDGVSKHTLDTYGSKADAEKQLSVANDLWNRGDHDGINNLAERIYQNNKNIGQRSGRYSEYQLPGGTNYSELLLTLPERGQRGPTGYENWRKLTGREDSPEARHEYNYSSASGENRISDANYRSPHWDEPNVLAHVRFNDRDIGGKKTLFLEEVQSDWHQAGRKGGYKISDTWNNEKANELLDLREKDPQHMSVAELNRIDQLVEERKNSQKVPDAPFKKSWPNLVLKRMIRHATENGYDAIAWTPGEVQAARWRGTGEQGHKKFYDEILVNAANDLAKKFGGKTKQEKLAGAKVGKRVAPGSYENASQDVHYLELTPAMRDTATRKGFPLFSGGHMLVPVDADDKMKRDDGFHPELIGARKAKDGHWYVQQGDQYFRVDHGF